MVQIVLAWLKEIISDAFVIWGNLLCNRLSFDKSKLFHRYFCISVMNNATLMKKRKMGLTPLGKFRPQNVSMWVSIFILNLIVNMINTSSIGC